jgi:hypothetical protein
MADAPTIKFTGAGSRREAAQLGQAIGTGVSRALAGRAQSLQIDTLRVQVSAGAGQRDIDRAIRAAIARKMQGGGR